MKILLTSLLGLSTIGGGLVPTLTNLNHSNIIQNIDAQDSRTVSLGEVVTRETNNSDNTFSIDFDWNHSSAIKHVQFHNGGLSSFMQWGSDDWTHSWDQLDVTADGVGHEVFRDTHWSFLANAETVIFVYLTPLNTGYNFKLYVSTQSHNSGATAWGLLKIGDQLTFTS